MPFLILFATALMAFQGQLTDFAERHRLAARSDDHMPPLLLAVAFLLAVYGAYFGAGLGILTLAVFAVLIPDDMQRLNALKGMSSLLINAVAVVYFAAFGPVEWAPAAVMAIGALAGGYLGAGVARRLGQERLRTAVVGFGVDHYRHPLHSPPVNLRESALRTAARMARYNVSHLMKYRNLGNTGIQVSAVGFGLWTVSTGWWGIDDERHGLDLLRKAYDSGVTFFDTADTYGQGKGETMLADALGDVRDRIVIATKFGYDFYNNTNERDGHKELPQDFSPKHIRFAVEQSLEAPAHRLHRRVSDAQPAHVGGPER